MLDGESTNVSNCVCAPATTKHRGKSHKGRRHPRGIREHLGVGVLLETCVQLEGTESSRTAGVNNAFCNPLMIKAVDFLSGGVIFEQLRTRLVLVRGGEPVICVPSSEVSARS